jgi:hypothetical protein
LYLFLSKYLQFAISESARLAHCFLHR